MTKIKKNKHVNEKTGEELLTRSSLALSGSSCKVTAQLGLTLLLKIAVDSPVAVVFDCVWVVTRTVLKDWGTVSSSSTSIVQCLLKSLVTHPIFTYAISSTYSTEPRTRKSVTWQKPLWFSDFFLKLKQKDRHFQEQIEKEQKKDWNFAGNKGVIVIHNLHINNKRAKFI